MQEAPDRRLILFLYFLHMQHHIKNQGAPDRLPVLLLYFLHAQHRVQKVRGSQSEIIVLFISNHSRSIYIYIYIYIYIHQPAYVRYSTKLFQYKFIN
jgi:hypothetical protein